MAKKKESLNLEDYIHVSPNPSWIDASETEGMIDDNFHRIMDFYVVFCMCSNYSTQGRTLSSYGWKDKPWNTYSYLKKELEYCRDTEICHQRKAVSWKRLKETIEKNLDSEWYDINTEYAYFSSVETNEFMSLFYHIRCALAHGRFSIKQHENERFYLFENGVQWGRLFYVKARCCIKETTLLHWIDVIRTKASKPERDIPSLVLSEIIKNPATSEKRISSIAQLNSFEIKNSVAILKNLIGLNYRRP